MLPFSTLIPVRFRDLDAMGHVNNAVYFTYIEVGRQDYWFALTGQRTVNAFEFIVGKAECVYRSPACLGEVVRVRMGVTRMGGASFTMRYELTEAASGRLIAEASTELVCYDYVAKRPRRLAEDERRAIEAFEASLASSAS